MKFRAENRTLPKSGHVTSATLLAFIGAPTPANDQIKKLPTPLTTATFNVDAGKLKLNVNSSTLALNPQGENRL